MKWGLDEMGVGWGWMVCEGKDIGIEREGGCVTEIERVCVCERERGEKDSTHLPLILTYPAIGLCRE